MSSSIGIDIGYETVKIIGLNRAGKKHWRLRGMNIANIPLSSWQTDALMNVDQIAAAIKDSLRLAKPGSITGKKAFVALPESVIFSGTFSMPLLSSSELKQAIPLELAEKLSINLEEFYFDYESVTTKCRPLSAEELKEVQAQKAAEKTDGKEKEDDTPQPGQDLLTVFAVAAKKTLIQSVVELCQKADLELVAIDIKPGAIARAVIPDNDQKARAILDLGAGSTGASIVEGQSIRVTSTVPWGVKDLLGKETPVEVLQKEFASVFDELVHITKFFENRVCPGTRVEEIVLSGSGTTIPLVVDVFQRETGLKTILGEPFKHVDLHHYPIKQELMHNFSDAVGLAMRES